MDLKSFPLTDKDNGRKDSGNPHGDVNRIFEWWR
ncbi:MAG: hypothetical protein HW389_2867 [Bacteroidetes bacterium]|nr:hypothetical protein [Bacteroidota bacterium]